MKRSSRALPQSSLNLPPLSRVSVRYRALLCQVLDMARKLSASGAELLVIDTESKYISSGLAEQLADTVRTLCHPD